MSHKDKVSLLFVLAGLVSGTILSFALPEEKLIIALSAPSALIGAGLAQWSSSSNEKDK